MEEWLNRPLLTEAIAGRLAKAESDSTADILAAQTP
jgi:hypothetical protein